MATDLDLLEVRLGSIEAAAGCGKTELIASTLRRCRPAEKPVLVLTHTNAGANALQQRLSKRDIPSSVYRVLTIDGWAMRMVSAFPAGSSYDLPSAGRSLNYPAIRRGAAHLLATGNIDPLLAATYSRLIVDEYQDCCTVQHEVVSSISRTLPTVVLGDPLQAIFGLNGSVLVRWDDAVAKFPTIGPLNKPWRWINAGAQPLGEWLMDIRADLKAGNPIDIGKGQPGVQWVEATAKDVQGRMKAAAYKHPDGDGSLLIIAEGSDKKGQKNFAKRTPGASTVEAVDLKDLTTFAATYKPGSSGCLDQLLAFGADVMTKVDPAGMRMRLKALSGTRPTTEASIAETAAQAYLAQPSVEAAHRLLRALSTNTGARVYRPAIYYGCLDAMSRVLKSGQSLSDAAVSVRELQRHKVRVMPKRAVGSTLLLKGLEADVAVVMHPEKMTAQHLYVALTRGAKKVLVCSPTQILTPLKAKSP
ncbi:UvrD-helicase domain-containing protein [Delftia sp. ASV31]|uniref:UvrD-helicase domain-containing protein n=1 Tax=Delftia sp. ASV31 TaxID=2795113 RepID=UPI0018EE0CAD|nr:UvrD-helicase domain-containing protein [Delftia sp. ASV31]